MFKIQLNVSSLLLKLHLYFLVLRSFALVSRDPKERKRSHYCSGTVALAFSTSVSPAKEGISLIAAPEKNIHTTVQQLFFIWWNHLYIFAVCPRLKSATATSANRVIHARNPWAMRDYQFGHTSHSYRRLRPSKDSVLIFTGPLVTSSLESSFCFANPPRTIPLP